MKKQYRLLEALCCLVYFSSYITRINFGVVVAEIIAAEGLDKSAVSVVVTTGFIAYGAGQLISGAMGDLFSAKKLIFIGFLVTSGCNLMIPFCRAVPMMAVVWFVNGMAQALMWPPMMKLMTCYLEGRYFSRAAVNISAAGAIGTIFVYLSAPLFIQIGSWKTVFYFSACMGILTAVIWNTALPRAIKQLKPVTGVQQAQPQPSPMAVPELIRKYGLVYICTAIIAQGVLRDGITTWMPSYITEVFHVKAAASILVSVILPLFAIFSLKFFGFLQQRLAENEIRLSARLFLICFLFMISWGMFYSQSMLLSVLLPALAIGLVHGINLMLTCVLPKRFAESGRVAFISGILNFFAYVGSALSAYGIARLSEAAGWQMTIWSWGLIAVIGFMMCGVCIRKFNTPSL